MTAAATLRKTIRIIVAITISYNICEAVIALVAGGHADSIALIGFGLDSCVEVGSAAAVAWQFAGPRPEEREKTALALIAASFFALSAYVALGSIATLAGWQTPHESPVGIILAAASVIVMPVLSLWERRTGQRLGSASAVADSKQTLVCAQLSAAVLIGLVANWAFGWWWADPVCALVIAWFAFREGREAWGGHTCARPVQALTSQGEDEGHCCC